MLTEANSNVSFGMHNCETLEGLHIYPATLSFDGLLGKSWLVCTFLPKRWGLTNLCFRGLLSCILLLLYGQGSMGWLTNETSSLLVRPSGQCHVQTNAFWQHWRQLRSCCIWTNSRPAPLQVSEKHSGAPKRPMISDFQTSPSCSLMTAQ